MSMNAVVYKGPNDVAVEEVDEPEIEHPNDVLIDITTADSSRRRSGGIKFACGDVAAPRW